MIATCISEPVSYLRMERLLVEELEQREREAVQQHLAECDVCRRCYEQLRADTEQLPSLPRQGPATVVTPLWRRKPLLSVTVFAAAAAALLMVARPVQAPGARQGGAPSSTKGGDLSVTLVRNHAGSLAVDPSRYVAGDRFEVRVTCPPGAPQRWDVAVFQAGEVFFPLEASSELHCGNQVTLPGAFSLTGTQPARVCVALQPVGALDRARLARELPASSACVEVVAGP